MNNYGKSSSCKASSALGNCPIWGWICILIHEITTYKLNTNSVSMETDSSVENCQILMIGREVLEMLCVLVCTQHLMASYQRQCGVFFITLYVYHYLNSFGHYEYNMVHSHRPGFSP